MGPNKRRMLFSYIVFNAKLTIQYIDVSSEVKGRGGIAQIANAILMAIYDYAPPLLLRRSTYDLVAPPCVRACIF